MFKYLYRSYLLFFQLAFFCLASCAPWTEVPTPTVTMTVMPSATITATSTPGPTATPVTYIPGLTTQAPEPEDSFVQQVANEHYLSVMGITRDQVSLIYQEHTTIDGEPYVVMVDESTEVPMAVFTGGTWQGATLKFFGKQVGLVIGNSGFPSDRFPIIDQNTKI